MSDHGTPFTALPQLTWVRDIEAFEGPLLSELRGPEGTLFLEKSGTFDGRIARTLIVRSYQRAVAEYLAKRITMRRLLSAADDVGFIASYQDGERSCVELVQVSKLGTDFLPDDDAMHDESLRPEWPTTPQSFLVDRSWNVGLLSDLEERYLSVFSFSYFLDARSPKKLPPWLYEYVLDGIGYAHLYRAMRKAVPANDQARATQVAAASPGVLTIEAPTETARIVNDVLQSANSLETRKAVRAVHRWSVLERDYIEDLPHDAKDDLAALAEALRVDLTKAMPFEGGDFRGHLLNAGKLLVGYYGRLRELQRLPSGVQFLAPELLPPPKTQSAAGPPAQDTVVTRKATESTDDLDLELAGDDDDIPF
jgi:hypothetical protein